MNFEFVEQQFRILAKHPDTNSPEWFNVAGLVYRSFGVFRFDDHAAAGWSVTHLPSGRRIFAAASEAAARGIVERLLAAEFDWTQAEFSPADTTEIVSFINRRLLPEFLANQWLAANEDAERLSRAPRN